MSNAAVMALSAVVLVLAAPRAILAQQLRGVPATGRGLHSFTSQLNLSRV